MTAAGGGEIILPHPDVDILEDGSIWDQETQLGQVGLLLIEDKSVLQKVGGEMFVTSDGSQGNVHPNPKVVQSNLESSNIDMMKEMVRMTANLRAFEATQKALKIYSDMGSKSSEIGLVQ